MALVNPQIAMSYRPTTEYQPRNALAEYAQLQSIMGGQRQAEVAEMQMDALRRKEKAISQIQATAAKNGGPTDRREIARAYINSGVPDFMQFGLTMDKDLDELDAFSRIMGGGAGGAARAAPSAAAAAGANAMAAPAAAAAPAGELVAAPVAAQAAQPSAAAPVIAAARQRSGPAKEIFEEYGEEAARFFEDKGYFVPSMFTPLAAQRREDPEVTARMAVFDDSIKKFREAEAASSARFRAAVGLPPRDSAPAGATNALAPAAAAPGTNAMVALAAQPATPPAGVQLASAGAAPAGTAQTDPTVALRARRDQLIALGTSRALQAARSLDADIALLSRTTAVAPGSTVIGPAGNVVYQAGAAPSSIATLEAEIAALKKAGATEDSSQVQARKAAIQQASGQSTDLIRNYNAAVAAGFKGNIFEYQRQIAAAGRAPVQPVAPTVTTVEDPTKPGSFLQVDARTYRGGGAGSPGVIGNARPSATAEKTAAQRAQMGKDLDFAISELSNITKDGGLIDQSTGSGAGRLVDIGAGFVGQATTGAIAIGKIEPVADLALKMIPRFEGPQSDKDTASYKAAAGQLADPTLPTAIRKEAGRTVLRLMRERKNQFVTRDMAAESAGAAPSSNAPDPLGIR